MNVNTTSTATNAAYSSKGLSGMISGMDTEALVQSQLANIQNKIDKQEAAKQQLEWKQEQYRGVITKVNDFYDKYFDITSDTCLTLTSTFNKLTNTSSSSAIKVSGSSIAGEMSIQVAQLATKSTLTSGKVGASQIAIGLDESFFEATAQSVKLTAGDKSLDITVTSESNLDDVVAQINNSDLGIKAEVDEDGKLKLTSDDETAFSVDGTQSALSSLGLKAGTATVDETTDVYTVAGSQKADLTKVTEQKKDSATITFSLDGVAKTVTLSGEMTAERIQLREEISEQIKALNEMAQLGETYGFDIRKPAQNTKEAIQWLYFGYLSAVKEQNGAAMSIGRTSTFLDIYIERDLANGTFTEEQVQEMIDHFIMKLRLVRFARTPEYNSLFTGDPTWVTESIGGMGIDGRSLVTKNSFRYLHTLENLGAAPEPNLTVLWSKRLPKAFKEYCAHISIKTSSIQYENDDMMRVTHGDDYAIACCVSSMVVGKEMQFFGARANLAKCLLYAINGGVDERLKEQVGPKYAPITSEYLDYDEVMARFEGMMEWLAGLYVNTLNLIQYMHDKYYYEAAELSLMDTDLKRTFATGIAGFSHVIDSLSAIKYAKVKTVRDENGLVKDYEIEGDFPRYGNDDDRADEIGVWLLGTFMDKIKKHHTYRDSEPTTSILTITSNVVYGKATGSMPDGRKAGEPLSPGANPSYGAEQNGLLASLNSLTKLPYEWALDGISNTQTINPGALGNNEDERISNLVQVMDGYFDQGAHHLNVNVFGKEKLIDAMEHPEKEEYANFTIRVSGYAVKFIDLTREQQLDVIARTCHERM